MQTNFEIATDHPVIERIFEPVTSAREPSRLPRDNSESPALAAMHNFLASFLSSSPSPRETIEPE